MTLRQSGDRIVSVEWGCFTAKRPRAAGSNARLGEHGRTVRSPIARIATQAGAVGFGWSWGSRADAERLVGRTLDAVFEERGGVREECFAFDIPLWDLAGKLAGQPVWKLAARESSPFQDRVPCYDTSLYFDDLHLASDAEAAALMAREARDGYAQGHRAFKLKVGRGALHMPSEEGMRRDIAVVHAVRDAVGADAPLMVDVNNGWNVNLTKRFLEETAGCGIFWLEEAFQEDATLYGHLRRWMAEKGLPTLIADGEGGAPPWFLDWAREGLIDVVQYDVFSYGFTRWLSLGSQLDDWGVRSAPHHYGAHQGNYVTGHLASAIQGFTYVEWDEADAPGLDGSAYAVENGFVHLPDLPGFGLALDEDRFQNAVADGGWRVTL